MKNKLSAILLALLMIVSAFPASAVSMAGVESAEEISEYMPTEDVFAETMTLKDGVIVFEDFENVTPGTVITSYDENGNQTKHGSVNIAAVAGPLYSASLWQGDQKANITVDTVDGNNVLKIASVANYANDYRMVNLTLLTDSSGSFGLTANNAGKYQFSYKYYLASDAVSEKQIVTIFREAGNLWKGYERTKLSHGTWYDYSIDFEITSDGKVISGDSNNFGTISGSLKNLCMTSEYNKIDGVSASDVCYYLDDLQLSYIPSSVITYADKYGKTLYTQTACAGDVITLAGETELGFAPLYEINGRTYLNSTYTVNGNVTITVSESNILYAETFENYADGDKLYKEGTLGNKVLPPIWFGVKPSYITVENNKFEITNTDCYEVTVDEKTYRSTESFVVDEYNGNKYAVIEGYKALHNNTGFIFKGLDFTNPGTYTLSMLVNVVEGNGGTWNQAKQGAPVISSLSSKTLNAASETEFIKYTNTFEVSLNNGVYSISATNNMNTNIVTATSETAVTDGWVIMYFNAAGSDQTSPVKVNVDDIVLTYEEPVVINASFVDENGIAFDYTDTQYGSYILPTANDLGLAYEPKFTDSLGYEYYPGTTFNGNGNVEFTVSKSDVILFEDFTNIESGYATPAYAREGLADSKIDGTTRSISPSGSLAFKTRNITTPEKYSDTPNFLQNFDFSKPGVYNFSVDVELEVVKSADTDLVDDGFYANIQIIPGWRGMSSNVNINVANPKATIVGTLEVYERDGVLYYKVTGQENEYTTITNSANKWIRIGYVHSNAFKKIEGTKAAHYVYADNFKVTYTPYAPETVKLASYRPESENLSAGIRFASYLTDEQIQKSSEFGFVVTRKSFITVEGITDYDMLNLDGVDAVSYKDTTSAVNKDGVTVVARASYNGTSARIFTEDGSDIDGSYKGLLADFFTGVLCGIDDQYKDQIFVARPYAKVDGEYYYGECHEASFNEAYAKANA